MEDCNRVTPIRFRETLRKINDGLDSRDLRSIKFLCHDIIDASTLERTDQSLGLFTALEQRNLLGPTDTKVLAEVLFRIGRIDLAKKLGYSNEELQQTFSDYKSSLPHFRVFVHQITEDLNLTELRNMKFDASQYLPQTMLERIDTPELLFIALEQKGLLSENNSVILHDMFQTIHRNDLSDKLHHYEDLKASGQLGGTPLGMSNHRIDHSPSANQHQLPGHRSPPLANQESRPTRRSHQPANHLEDALRGQYHPANQHQGIFRGSQQPASQQQRQSPVSQPTESQPEDQIHGQYRNTRQNNESPPIYGTSTVNQLQPQNNSQNRDSVVPIGHVAPGIRPSEPPGGQVTSSSPEQQQRATVMERLQRGPAPGPPGGQERQQEPASPNFELLTSIPSTVLEIEDEEDLDLPISLTMRQYKMTAKPRGICIVINNEKFQQIPNDNQSERLDERKGSSIDRGNLHYVWVKLGFPTVIYDNLTDTEMVQVIAHFASQDHSKFDAFVCCILSHGKQGTIYGSNGKQVKISELTKYFGAVRCKTLVGKPKLFFIQACQGLKRQPAVRRISVDAPEGPRNDQWVETIPNEADFLLGYATVPGFVSYRSKENGTWYITCLTMMLDRLSEKHDLLSILTKVNSVVSQQYMQDENTGHYCTQVPAPQYTLTKQVFFHPRAAAKYGFTMPQ